MELTEAQLHRMAEENADAGLGERPILRSQAPITLGNNAVKKTVTVESEREIPPVRRMSGNGSFA